MRARVAGLMGIHGLTVINLQNFGLRRKGLERKLYWAYVATSLRQTNLKRHMYNKQQQTNESTMQCFHLVISSRTLCSYSSRCATKKYSANGADNCDTLDRRVHPTPLHSPQCPIHRYHRYDHLERPVSDDAMRPESRPGRDVDGEERPCPHSLRLPLESRSRRKPGDTPKL
jgi:hypothetical protein